MSRKLRAVGVDPAFNNSGFCRGFIESGVGGGRLFVPSSIHLAQTKPAKAKSIKKSADDFARAQYLAEEIRAHTAGADVVFVEMPTGSRSARAAKTLGIAVGCLTGIESPIVSVSALQGKLALTGQRHASKAEMIEAAKARNPELEWTGTLKDEHMADALAAVLAGMQTAQFFDMVFND